MGGLAADFVAILGKQNVLHGAATRKAYDCDAYTVDRYEPEVVVLPASTEQVVQVVRHCNRVGAPFTVRGAGTGLSGGVLPAQGGVVISTKRMTLVVEIDAANRCLLAQAGITNVAVSEAAKPFGLHFAPDPSSQTVSTLGGNIGENAGGPHTLKYGVTTQHVLGVTLVDPSGEVIQIGGKGGCGPGYDWLGLIVGGEGTLGVVTEAWVKLTPLPRVIRTALVAFQEVGQATQSVADIVSEGIIPAALEMVDAGIMGAMRAAFGLEYPEGSQALLLVECDDGGGNAVDVDAQMQQVTTICERNMATDIRHAANGAERTKLWTARKKGVGALGRIAPTVVTHDGVIPRSKLPEMLSYVAEVGKKHGLYVANIFHAGDGNLHPIFCFNEREPGKIEAVVAAGEEIMRRCVELGGSLSGEHGIGVEKVDLMPLMFAPQDLEAQALAKTIFNDGTLCNPCKVLPSQKSCTEHRKRWRGAAW